MAVPWIWNPHSVSTFVFNVREGQELMYWQSETDDVICVQLAP
jgi:hypothetical protein